MAFSSWLCTNGTKNMLVKIVHPGGHVELHDRPVPAAEIMLRNPRCCVAHPHVFQQPWAIVAPDTMLPLGKKFYVVPISTIRKLQRHALKNSPAQAQEMQTGQSCRDEGESDSKVSRRCWLFTNKNGRERIPNETEKDGCLGGDDNCFMCLIISNKIKGNGDDSSKETRSPSSLGSSSETKELTGKRRTMDLTRKGLIEEASKRRLSFDHWQPSLQSITEE